MTDPTNSQQDASTFARKAVEFDRVHEYSTAIFYYTEAAQALVSDFRGSIPPYIIDKTKEYINRAETLKSMKTEQTASNTLNTKSEQQMDLERAKFLLNQAFEEDEKGNVSEAVELYTQSVEMFLSVRSKTDIESLKNNAEAMAKQALKRAEDLKPQTQAKAKSPQTSHQSNRKVRPLGLSLWEDDDDAQENRDISPLSNPGTRVSGSSGYTKEEIRVLRTTSLINGREYVPFMSVDIREKFAFPVPYTDRHGKLALSAKQKERLSSWMRPEDFCDNPQMIYAVSSFSIRQTIVSDCSFVASLAISAQYERRFKRKLITSIIYPQNRQGDPVYNPCGKYMVKLHINGVQRKVIIDDLLPMSKDGELLCSFSNNRNELWVALLEKAYMRVMGGYDFPGSNSNIDMHALTGWIPERIAIHSSTTEFDKAKEFNRIMDRFHKGHCLVTIATGVMTEDVGSRAGLVPTHAYAMLDIREFKGHRLFMLKNPWNHLRWKGNFSENDPIHWTKEMQDALNYDPKSAQMFDNGVFWIDYESLCRFYDVIYINWNPELFSNTTCMHQLIVFIYEISDDPPPYKDGVRINSPHYLCKMVENPGTHTYSLVISQYEKNNTIHYTLRVYASCEITLNRISEPYNPKYEKRITGQWKGSTAGGCGNCQETFHKNPIYQVKIDNSLCTNCFMIELRGPREYSVGFELIPVSVNVTTDSQKKQSSGDYRKGFCVLQKDNISGGVYNIMPTTFYPGKEGPFFLNISSNVPLTVTQLQ